MKQAEFIRIARGLPSDRQLADRLVGWNGPASGAVVLVRGPRAPNIFPDAPFTSATGWKSWIHIAFSRRL
jgi:hypothetical protein